ncbi:MAG: thiamine pyrophosphate-binding protein [Lachnospiraceae bacterium]|jgi:acetolactate synthase-1/2/3 large subunit|nr:thiamine pyrophosphate-binding protein [Lachnospiraceae bacterium]MEE3460925.1 thiamine pyrophosphate-binding protein [Lachnospiraceae bacterium]
MKKRAADIIMDTLIEENITDCFAVVGGGAMYLDNALLKCTKMHKMFNHHEQACAIAAEGYAKISGHIPFVCVTSGPGTTNTLTGVMGAWVDSVPMLIISGQMRYDVTVASTGLPLRFRGGQEFNIVDTVKTMTKYSKMVTDPLDVKAEVKKAVHIATTGRRGPVWLDIPLDVQMAMVDEACLHEYVNKEKLPVIKTSDAAELLIKLEQAERPVILAGNGIINSGSYNEFFDFAHMLNVPVISTLCAGDVMGRDDPIYYGGSGSIGPRTGNFILQNSDFILALGTSMGFKTTGYVQDAFARKAYIVMVDVDVFEVQKPGVRVDLFIHSDLHEFFRVMNSSFDLHEISISDKWKDYCNDVKQRFTPFEAAEGLSPDDRICSYYFWKVFEKYEEDDSILALGNNTGISAKIQIGVKKDGQRFIVNNNCGSMGYDLPAAIGAAAGSGRTVYCATGDGSIMMNLQELQTIKHYKLPVKIIVFANDGYNAIRQTSKNFFNGELIGCTPDSGVSFPDFRKVADTFEFPCRECHTNAETDEAVKWLVAQPDRAMLILDERLDDPVTPKVMSRVDENGKFITPALQDMYPFLPEDEMKELMKISQ